MVNPEYIEEVKKKFGKCAECGDDNIEYVIKSSSLIEFFHINCYGALSKRNDFEIESCLKAFCLKCYQDLVKNLE